MIYPESIEEKLGFDVIRQRLSDNCVSVLGKKLVQEIRFGKNFRIIVDSLVQVNDFVQLLNQGNIPAIAPITDLAAHIDKSKLEGNWLEAKELYEVYLSISSAVILADFLSQASEEFKSFLSLVPELGALPVLEKQLQKSVDKEGAVLDSASRELKKIRQQIITEKGSLRKVVNTIFKRAKADGYIPEGASVGVRDGRMVIPVIASNKRQVAGFIHDESATGNIVFLEPTAILDANNKIRELEIAEKREIRLILTDLTKEVNHHQLMLRNANAFLAKIDLLWSKAKLANALAAVLPEITETMVDLRDLRHPLLISTGKNQQRKIVPHNIKLDRSERFLLISGPNAGGKSVALKSMGLNQMMLQSGVLPCCSPDSKFMLFDDLFIDIGDEQSIDNDLSTYSSHLQNMGVMLTNVTSKSLVLIDEFGSGTDPAFGGAIAEAVLKRLLTKECFGIITTHFGNLKVYADKATGIANAAMVFDLDELKPLYQLETGRPGSSFSLEVAAQSGLPPKVIDDAQKSVGANQVDIERLLGKLEHEKRKLEEEKSILDTQNKELSLLKSEYIDLKEKLEDQKREIISKAKVEATTILSQTNKEIEKTIRHIKENKAEKKETKKIRKTLQDFAAKVAPETRKKPKSRPEIIDGVLKIGDQAILESGVIGEIVEIKGKKAKLMFGELQSIVSLNALKKISNRQVKQSQGAGKTGAIAKKVNAKMMNFTPVLDVRGKRANEVLPVLQQFIDEAVMLNQANVKVIHGRGNGVLRQLVRDELGQWSQVSKFIDEHADRGGDGVTLITLK